MIDVILCLIEKVRKIKNDKRRYKEAQKQIRQKMYIANE